MKLGGKIFLGALLLIGAWVMFAPSRISLNQVVTLEEGQSVSEVMKTVAPSPQYKLQYVLRQQNDQLQSIQPGKYIFSGSYTPNEIIEVFLQGPQIVYDRMTILEGWSKYDIDAALVNKSRIETGAYLSFVDNSDRIEDYTEIYEFLKLASEERGALSSLEGYLYPDTYYIDTSKDIISQLVKLQLQAFQDKVWRPYGGSLRNMTQTIRDLGYGLRLTTYGTIIIASIVEKEEKILQNKSPVTSVFLNRLNEGMQLGADITLCYGLAQPYSKCNPDVIVANLTDATNLYNTRVLSGLTPTPIGNPSIETIKSVLDVTVSPYFYYLHAPDGSIYFGRTLAEHNQNKATYLR